MHAFITKAEVEEDGDYYKKEIQQFEVEMWNNLYEYVG